MILTLSMIWLFSHTTRDKCETKHTPLVETTAATLGLNVNKGKPRSRKPTARTTVQLHYKEKS